MGLTIQKAKRAYKCSNCGREMEFGEACYKLGRRFARAQYRCLVCRPQPSGLSGSYGFYLLCDDQGSKPNILERAREEFILYFRAG